MLVRKKKIKENETDAKCGLDIRKEQQFIHIFVRIENAFLELSGFIDEKVTTASKLGHS